MDDNFKLKSDSTLDSKSSKSIKPANGKFNDSDNDIPPSSCIKKALISIPLKKLSIRNDNFHLTELLKTSTMPKSSMDDNLKLSSTIQSKRYRQQKFISKNDKLFKEDQAKLIDSNVINLSKFISKKTNQSTLDDTGKKVKLPIIVKQSDWKPKSKDQCQKKRLSPKSFSIFKIMANKKLHKTPKCTSCNLLNDQRNKSAKYDEKAFEIFKLFDHNQLSQFSLVNQQKSLKDQTKTLKILKIGLEKIEPKKMIIKSEDKSSIERIRFSLTLSEDDENKPMALLMEELANAKITDLLLERNYKPIKCIGIGTRSKVFLVMKDKEYFAARIIILDKLSLSAKKLLLPNELKVLPMTKHSNIVEYLEMIKNNDYIIIINEYIDGGNLLQWCKQRSQPSNLNNISMAKHFFQQILNAMNYLHLKGIAHRDIRPNHILISNGVAKIANFSTAKYCRNPDTDQVIMDSKLNGIEFRFDSCAPEIFHGLFDPFKVDCFSMGILLFFLVTNQYPFNVIPYNVVITEAMIDSMYDEIFERRWMLKLNNIDTNIISLCSQLLNPDVLERISIKQAIKHRWFTY